jgi:hypothetical protein
MTPRGSTGALRSPWCVLEAWRLFESGPLVASDGNVITDW